MLKNIIVLPDGTRIGSGVGADPVIQSCTLTECVNSGDELIPGSVCCACLEVKIFTASGDLAITAGDELQLYTVDDSGVRHRSGIFIAERPTKSSTNVYKVTAYDRVMLLDFDLSPWLNMIPWSDESPYTLARFARMACDACGVMLVNTEFTNGDLPVTKFQIGQITGRQLMRWICELACCFCRANADGNLEMDWYKSSNVTISPSGNRFYFSGGLSYEDYEVAAIDGVQYRLPYNGALYPEMDAANIYIIDDANLIWQNRIGREPEQYRKSIQDKLSLLGSYRPCKVSIPASLDIRAGDIITVTTQDGKELRVLVMTKTRTGQRDTLECTGSREYSNSTTANNLTPSKTAQRAVSNLSEQDILNKLNAHWIAVDGVRVLAKKEDTT